MKHSIPCNSEPMKNEKGTEVPVERTDTFRTFVK